MRDQLVEGPFHFIGIGGSGMAGLAELALSRSRKVQGSDRQQTPTLDRLSQLGAQIDVGHAGTQLASASTVVFSSAIAADNVELVEARRRGLTLLHRSDFLASLMQGHQAITVAGTHGKSTTSAMLTHVLDDLGCDPSAVIGGEMLRYGSPARHGGGDLFVAEADESDGSLLKYAPFIAVLTNVELDHLDYFKTAAAIDEVFAAYLARVQPNGTAVIGWDSPTLRALSAGFTGDNRLTYGFLLGSEVRALTSQAAGGRTEFTAIVERDQVRCSLPLFGRHNVQNALAVLAVCRALELDVKRAASSLEGFTGVGRRMTRVHATPSVQIYDDYAHNPGKVAACLLALKEAWPGQPLHVVYQPHRFSRLATMYDEMLDALKPADVVHVVPVYSAGESSDLDFSPGRLAADLRSRLSLTAFPCAGLAQATASVLGCLKGEAAPVVVLTVGAGDVWRVAHQLKAALE